jgi:hypothetical protein
MAAPDKTTQDAEALARNAAGVGPGESNATNVITDGEPGDIPAPGALAPAGEGDAPQRPAPPVRNVNDDKRDAILNRFRTKRITEAAEQADDISDFARSGMPADFQAQPAAPAADEVIEQQLDPQPAAPRKIKLIVHGKEVELDESDVIANAQKALASENILDEAKSKSRELDTILADARNRVARVDPPNTNQVRQPNTQTTEQAETGNEDPANQGNLTSLIEAIQFGDPGEAQQRLDKTIESKAEEIVSKTLQKQRFKDEGARTAKVLKDFEDQHAEIAQDPMARAAIEAEVLNQQTEDIRALGIDPATLRNDGQPPTPGDIAQAHRWYRTEGFKVRAPAELLEASTSKFLAWKGVKPTNTNAPADPATPPAQPRVDITVDRTARRAAIPQQPNRTSAAQPSQQQQQPAKPRDRSSIVHDMIQKRGQPRGKIVA